MEWSTFWTSLLTSLGGTGIILLLLMWLGKKWISIRIEESVRHEYSMKLEEHKAQLQEQTNRSIRQMQAEFQAVVDQNTTDKSLFAKFLDTLPSSGSIEFIRNHDMGGAFERKNLDQLDCFFREWARPEYHFLDGDIDKKREYLHKIIGEYLEYISRDTWALKHNRNFISIPVEWKDEQPERFHETVKKLHDLADQIVKANRDLIQTARNRLKC